MTALAMCFRLGPVSGGDDAGQEAAPDVFGLRYRFQVVGIDAAYDAAFVV